MRTPSCGCARGRCRSCRAAGSSWRTRWRSSARRPARPRRARRRRVDGRSSPTAYCSAGRRASTASTSGTGSSTGRWPPMRACGRSIGRTSGPRRPICSPERVDLVVIDVSFISLRLVLPALPPFAKPGAPVIALVKPQFEVGRADVGKGGISLRDEAARGACAGPRCAPLRRSSASRSAPTPSRRSPAAKGTSNFCSRSACRRHLTVLNRLPLCESSSLALQDSSARI